MRYAKYKPTNIPWLPEVPETWEVRPFKSLYSFGKGLPITKENLTEKGVPVVSYGQIHSKNNVGIELKDELLRFVSPQYLETNPQSLLSFGDMAIADTSEDQEGCGNAVLCNRKENIFAGYHTIIARIKQPENAKYLAYVFMCKNWRSQIQCLVHGVKLFSITKQILSSAKFPLPPLAEQKRIVAYLDEKCAKIDTLVTAKTKQIELFKELRQSIIAEAVTKGIDGCKTFKPTNIPWLPEVPQTWEVKKMKYHFYERSEKGHPDEAPLCSTQAYGVIPQSMYENRIVIVDAKNLAQLKLVKKGDFVISLRAFQGGIEIAHYQGIISAAYTILELRDKANSNYFRWLFKSRPFIGLLKTCVTGIREGQNINYPLLSQKSLPLPPLAEQKRIVAYLDKKCAKIDTLLAKIEDEVIKLKEYRERLVADVVTGQRKVVK